MRVEKMKESKKIGNTSIEEQVRQIEDLFYQNKQQEALIHVNNLIDQTSDAKRPDQIWLHLYLQGLVPYYVEQKYQKALLPFNKSLKTATDHKLLFEEAKSQVTLGQIAYRLQDYEDAYNLFKRSFSLFKALKKKNMIKSQAGMIRSLLAMEKYEKAENLLKQATKNAQRLQDFESLADVLHVQGIIEQRKGLYRDALKSLRDSISLFKDCNNKQRMTKSYLRLIKVLTEKSNYVQALEIATQAEKIFLELDKQDTLVEDHELQGWCHYALEDYSGAIRNFHEAITLYLNNPKMSNIRLADLQKGILVAHIHLKEYTVVRQKLEEMETLNKRLNLDKLEQIIACNRGIVAFQQKKYVEAAQFFDDTKIESAMDDITKIRLLLYKFWLKLKERRNSNKEKPDNENTKDMRDIEEQINILVVQNDLHPLLVLITSLRGLIQAYELKNTKAKEKLETACSEAQKYDFKSFLQKDKERIKIVERGVLDSLSFSMFDENSIVEYQFAINQEIEECLQDAIVSTYIVKVCK